MDEDDLTINKEFEFHVFDGNIISESENPEYNYHKGNHIHITALVGNDVIMGKGNVVKAYCVIEGRTTIGDNNTFFQFSSIGSEPEHREYFGKENKGLIIGSNNVIRESVTINSGTEKPTIIGNHIIMLRGSHVGHDSTINDNCTISCNVMIGGHSLLGESVNMGLGSICHQYSRIGSYSMIGMGAIVPKKTSPECFSVYVGNPARYLKKNEYKSSHFTDAEQNEIVRAFNAVQNKTNP